MSNHGLWRWHRAARQSRKLSEIEGCAPRWWIEEELEDARTLVAKLAKGRMFASTTVISRCATRAIRRYKLPKNIEVWNQMVEEIAGRMGINKLTYRHCLVQGLFRDPIELCEFNLTPLLPNARLNMEIEQLGKLIGKWDAKFYSKQLREWYPSLTLVDAWKKKQQYHRNCEEVSQEKEDLKQARSIIKKLKGTLNENSTHNRRVA